MVVDEGGPKSLTEEELFCLEGCRSYEQYRHMRLQFEDGICPFCEVDPKINKIILEDEYVSTFAVPSEFMREELEYHFIIIPRRHIRYPWEMMINEVVSIHIAETFLAERYDLRGGIVATRFGDMHLNAGTVPHLHTNIMMPNGTGEVRIPVFKGITASGKGKTRAAEFAVRYETGEIPA